MTDTRVRQDAKIHPVSFVSAKQVHSGVRYVITYSNSMKKLGILKCGDAPDEISIAKRGIYRITDDREI